MKNRIDALRKSIDDNITVLISSRANILYYSGFTSEDAYIIITKEQAVIATDSRYFVQAQMQSPDLKLVDISKGLTNILNNFPKNIYIEEDYMTVGELNKISNDKRNIIPAQDKISSFRKFKDHEEIEKIRQAEKIGDMAFEHILSYIKPGVKEIDIALELEFYMRKQGASGLSFETIAASGVRSCMPHGTASEKVIENGDFLTLDFGCVYNGYCSDMTRTVAVGKVNDEQKKVYNTVLKAQRAALDSIVVGTSCKDIDKIARDIISDAGYGEYFGHGLGHSVGIEIHEKPVLSFRSNDVVSNGNILTVEPGIYIPNKFGVRIEDLVCVFDGKVENLTSSPKELIII